MTDQMLMQAIRLGDAAAMSVLTERYKKSLRRTARRAFHRTGTEEEWENCVGEVFLFLWMNPQKYDPASGTLKHYLKVMTQGRATNLYLQRGSHVPLMLRLACMTPESLLGYAGPENFRLALEALPQPEKEIILRRYYYGQSTRQVAASAVLPVPLIRKSLERAKRFLRRRIAEQVRCQEND